jgi:hypothetical protein
MTQDAEKLSAIITKEPSVQRSDDASSARETLMQDLRRSAPVNSRGGEAASARAPAVSEQRTHASSLCAPTQSGHRHALAAASEGSMAHASAPSQLTARDNQSLLDRAAELARQAAAANAIALEKLKTRAILQAKLRFLSKDAQIAFKAKSGATYQFNREALESLLSQLDSNVETVDIGGHDIPLGVFDNGVFSFAELDQTRVENGLQPVFSMIH